MCREYAPSFGAAGEETARKTGAPRTTPMELVRSVKRLLLFKFYDVDEDSGLGSSGGRSSSVTGAFCRVEGGVAIFCLEFVILVY